MERKYIARVRRPDGSTDEHEVETVEGEPLAQLDMVVRLGGNLVPFTAYEATEQPGWPPYRDYVTNVPESDA